MLKIKRYPNRKLYNTHEKKYITLEEIANFIRQGEDIQVLDFASGEDLTALTLTQVIMEQEKRTSGFLPNKLLTSLLRTKDGTWNKIQNLIVSPDGVLNQLDEEIKRRMDLLVYYNEISHEEASRILGRLLDPDFYVRGQGLSMSDEELLEIIRERGIPTREQINTLLEKLDIISQDIDQLDQ
ncbi:MAG: polyhydroxyalkanoate synthesis regulator DNA-binding domain-containing protein [Chloroflexota bacterium]